MAHPQIAVFARLANGNAQSVRKIEGQAAKLSRTMHSISYDEIHDEIVVTNPFAGSVLTFRGDANGEVPPIRIIQGSKTGFGQPDVMGVDPMNNEYYVPSGVGGGGGGGTIHVFPRMANGDVAPIRVLRGAGGTPSIDYQHNVILAEGGGVRIFDRMATGDAKPLRVVTGGPKSGVIPPSDPVWIPGTRNFVACTRSLGKVTRGDRPGAPGNYQTVDDAATFFGVWSIDDDGDVPPRYTIGHSVFKEFRNFAINGKNKEVMVSDKTQNSIFTFSFPEAWETFTPMTAAPFVPPTGRGAAAGFGGGCG